MPDIERKWIWVGLTVFCALSTSFTSTNWLRGAVAPILTLVFAFVAVMAFVQARIEQNRGHDHYEPTEAERAALEAARQRRAQQADREPPESGDEARDGSRADGD